MEELTRYKYTLRKPSSAKSDSSSSKTPHDLNMVSIIGELLFHSNCYLAENLKINKFNPLVILVGMHMY